MARVPLFSWSFSPFWHCQAHLLLAIECFAVAHFACGAYIGWGSEAATSLAFDFLIQHCFHKDIDGRLLRAFRNNGSLRNFPSLVTVWRALVGLFECFLQEGKPKRK